MLDSYEKIFTQGNLEQVKKLMQINRMKKIDLPLGKNPLHFAVENKDPAVLIYLLEDIGLKSDINTMSRNKVAPIHEAASCGNINSIRILIEFGADFKAKDFSGRNLIDVLKSLKKFNLVHPVEEIIKKIHFSEPAEDVKNSFLIGRNKSNIDSTQAFFNKRSGAVESESEEKIFLLDKKNK